MKLILKALLCFTIFAVILNSCKKTSIFDEQGNLEANSEFNTANIKTWYYKTFENSAEALQTNNVDKKYPIWKNGIYYKFSTFEVFEFPLVKNKKHTSVPSNLSTADRKRVAESSLTRIRIIKNKEGKISVVEVNYISEINYLRNNNYDISKVAMGKQNSDFTGKMILKKWSGKQIGSYILKNGKVTGKVKITSEFAASRNESQNIFGSCAPGQTEWGIFSQTCDVYPDGYMSNCSDWELVPGSEWCEGEATDPCEGMSEAACECQEVGECGSGEDPSEEDEPVVKTFDFVNEYAIKVSGSGGTNEDWKMWYEATITGNKFNDPTKNIYTSFVGDPVNSHFYQNNNPAMGGLFGYSSSQVYCHDIAGSGSVSSEIIESGKNLEAFMEGV